VSISKIIQKNSKEAPFYELLNDTSLITVFDLLDFHTSYEKITKKLDNFCSFDYI
jgi:hypothetical protein